MMKQSDYVRIQTPRPTYANMELLKWLSEDLRIFAMYGGIFEVTICDWGPWKSESGCTYWSAASRHWVVQLPTIRYTNGIQMDGVNNTRSLPKFQKSKTKKKCKITCVVIQAGPYWSKIHARLNEMTSVFGNKKWKSIFISYFLKTLVFSFLKTLVVINENYTRWWPSNQLARLFSFNDAE